jgi:hypothetical protein
MCQESLYIQKNIFYFAAELPLIQYLNHFAFISLVYIMIKSNGYILTSTRLLHVSDETFDI